MFLHNFKYEFLRILREKEIIFWMMCFPIILGTLFKVAFGNLNEEEKMYNAIPVCIVDTAQDAVFSTVMDSLSEGDTPLFEAEFITEDEALEKLEEGDICGIIYTGEKLSLSVASNSLKVSILQSFVQQYEIQRAVITDIALNNPERLSDVTQALSADINAAEKVSVSEGNMDPYAQYFFNLIAMVALFGTTVGLEAATRNQGNLSAIGARKCVSPTHKLKSIIATLLAGYFVQLICVALSTTYILYVLKIDMGDNIPMLYLSGAIGTFTGVTLGFLIGSVGTASENMKMGILTGATMFCCFLSGLMVGTMKAVVEKTAPVVNRLNPAALISDLFYCLTVYDDYTRYIKAAVSLIIMGIVFAAAGFMLTRRKKYASI